VAEQCAVVTGAGSGIGRATAQALAARGLSVFCVGRRPEPLRETAASIGDSARVVPADVSTDDGIGAVHDAVANDTVACVVHAAAVEGVLTLAETDRATFDELVATNLGGPFFLTRALLPAFGEGSAVVFVGSIAAFRGRERHAAYAATKAGLLGLTVNLAAELAPRVRVNCICVGATRTPMMEQAVRDYAAAVGEAGAHRLWTVETPRLLLGVAEAGADRCIDLVPRARCDVQHRHGPLRRRRVHGALSALRGTAARA
jgi:NAD(P)-dependent dehydrogenase (short-subunit alcohol dehydrogenase family)